MTPLTSEQATALAEAQRIADQVTKGYGVPSVHVYALGLDPGVGGTYAHHDDWIFIKPEMLTGQQMLVVISHELGHVTLRHGPIDSSTAERKYIAGQQERTANRRGVEILVKYLGFSEPQALDRYATFFITADRTHHGQEMLLPFGHRPPCEQLTTLFEDFARTAPPCGGTAKQ